MSHVPRTQLGHKLNAFVPFNNHKRKFLYSERDLLRLLSEEKIRSFVDLRKYDNQIMDQGTEGDCVAHASGGVWAYLQILKWRVKNRATYTKSTLQGYIQRLQDVSADYIYALCLAHDRDFGFDVGTYGSSAAFVLENFGACFADVWANTLYGHTRYPPNSVQDIAMEAKVKPYSLRDLDEVRRCHSKGYPTFFGVPVFWSWSSSLSTRIPMPGPNDYQQGGHELKSVGHDDSKGILIIANSWGHTVGDHGYFEMPYEYFDNYAADIHTARIIK